MAKMKFSVQSTVFETYVIDVPDDVKGAKMEEYFFNMKDDEKKKYLLDSESFEWQIDSVETA